MKLAFANNDMKSVAVDTVVVFTAEFKKLADKVLKDIDAASGGAVRTMLASEEFTGKEGQLTTVYHPKGFKAKRVVIAGLGEMGTIDHDSFRRAMGRASRYKGLTSSKTAAVYMGSFVDPECCCGAIEGYILGSYKMLEFRSGDARKDTNKLSRLVFIDKKKAALATIRKAVTRGQILAEGAVLTRDLACTPGNFLTPTIYANKAKKLAKQYKLSCQILNESAIVKEKMGAFLSVTRGSVQPPKFIIMKYNGGKAGEKPVVLVGKGITFDSGGISLKAGLNMHEMKQDMTGSAVVISTIVTAARLKVKKNIVCLVPACENMPSGKATKPGDIVTSRKGKTIEIINTDAEGRLILADALDYANKFNPEAVIDVATLTGASLYILGYAGAPIMGNNDKLLEGIEEASIATAERVWPLPIWDEHRDQMKGSIADLVNSGGRPAGTICAGAFLENFIGDWPWVHIDIAYMDLEPKGRPYTPKGAIGYGPRLLVELISNWKKL